MKQCDVIFYDIHYIYCSNLIVFIESSTRYECLVRPNKISKEKKKRYSSTSIHCVRKRLCNLFCSGYVRCVVVALCRILSSILF